jgi:predicted esterase YcpF (UPF0227 family)
MPGSILYIHGLNSSPDSQKARQMSALMQRIGLAEHLRVPALHHHPRQAIAQLEAALAELDAPLLVGSSLGGYYATHPVVNPHRLFDGYLGVQTNHYTGELWQLTQDHVTALAELEVPAPADPARFQVWLQTGDETLDYRQAAAFYQACSVHVENGGDHGFQGFARKLPALLEFAGIDAARYQAVDFAQL